MHMMDAQYVFGELLRDWRNRRGHTQADLATLANISTRHLSFVENGRSAASRSLVLSLCESLHVPLRSQNQMLLAAGFAPVFQERSLDDPGLAVVRSVLSRVLDGHDPYPALVVDGEWNLVDANAALYGLLEGLPTELTSPPCNVLRVTLHPNGLAPDILNFIEWRSHVLARLEQHLRSGHTNERGAALYAELSAYPIPPTCTAVPEQSNTDLEEAVVTPLRLRHGAEVLSLFSTVSTFGTPRDITVHELVIEALYPADEATARILRDLDARRRAAAEVMDFAG